MPDALPPGLAPCPPLHRFPAAGAPTLLFLHGAGCGGWVWEEGFAARCAAAGLPALVLNLAQTTQGQSAGLTDYVAQARAVLVLGAREDRLIDPDAVRRCALWHGVGAEFLPGGHLLMLEPGWEDVAGRLLCWVESLGE